jgi:dipeptidyl aminopeptidase/acylaminoacyl peptidase
MKRSVAMLTVFLLVFSLLATNVVPLGAQSAARKQPRAKSEPQLTLEAISRDPGKWGGTAPAQVRWTEDGAKLHFQWNPERADRNELYELAVNSPDAKPRKVGDAEKRWLSSNFGERNKAETLKVYVFQGDIYLHDLRSGKTRQITMTSDSESNARFTFDGKGILFSRSDNLFEWVIETGETRQLTDFRKGKDPDEKPKLTKQDEYLEKEQLELFEVLQKQEKDEKEQKERTKRERGPFPEPAYLKDTESVSRLQLSPDRSMVTFILTDRAEASKAKVPEMPKYVTKSGYVETERLGTQIGGGRVKVGAAQPVQKLGVMNAADGKITYVDMGLEKREFGFQLFVGEPAAFFGGAQAVAWSDDGKNAFCVVRAQDNNDRWIMLLDVAGAKAKILDAEHDDAWIQSQVPYGWLADNQTVWFRSERDGYFHVYTLSISGSGKPAQLTSGKWEVTGVQIAKDKSKFYLSTSETHPGERNLYSMAVTGGPRTRITSGDGVFDATLSPDEKLLAVSYTNPDGPPDLYRMENKPGAPMTRLVDSYTDEFKGYRWRKFEVVTIPDAYNNALYARLYKPDKPNPLRPAVIYVHGTGYAQSVFRNWGGYGGFDTTPFFNFLLHAGYTVLDLDYRGSAGYGRDCRTDIYRNMGGKDIDSAVAAAKWLASTQGVDARRIGIYGRSYGGFFTLMALFKHPGVFAAGAALAPVTDWAHYNHTYTSNILNLPYEDDEAYRRSSPIYFADGLKDRLLILHGMFDRNVNYQDTIRLVQHLIELKKTGWSLASMPIEDHIWQNEYSRLDSYRRIFDLFEEVLKRPLPAESKKTAKGK